MNRRTVTPVIASVSIVGLLLAGCSAQDSHEAEEPEATTPESPSASPDAEANENSDDTDDAEATDSENDSEDNNDGEEESSEQESEEAELPDWPASNTTVMSGETTISEPVISPKSVVASGHGLAIANNMMYTNTVTLYDTEEQELFQELSDEISPEEFGVDGYPETVVGAPVEAVWTEDGQYAYVSQYSLAGLGAEAYDDCGNGDAIAPSAVYRYSVEDEDWDQFIEVGRVPKFVELTPDGSKLLVSNWCDHDISVVDTETAEEIERIPANSQPRGIAAMPDNRTAYVSAMYANELYKLDLETGESELMFNELSFPRHLVLSPDAETLYVTFSRSNTLAAFDTSTDELIGTVETGLEPRTMDISEDGTALYVVNYDENSVSKFDTETLEEMERHNTDSLPIGVTYDPVTARVWVATYGGLLNIFDDSQPAE